MNRSSQRPAISYTFSEGQYLDMWSIVHLATGMVLGAVGTWVPLAEPWPFFIAVILMILWELFEVKVGVGEYKENLFVDIIIGVAGYGTALLLFTYTATEPLVLAAYCIPLIVILNIFGIYAYLQRHDKDTPKRSKD